MAATTTVYLTATALTSWTVPDDWNDAANTIEVIGGGGGGFSSSAAAGGGGGGAYSRILNIDLTPGGSVAVKIGTGGTAGIAGSDTYFNGATCAGASVCAKGGAGATSATGATGGLASNGIGSLKYSGGTGGAGAAVGDISCGGGAGGGGPYGNGANGGGGDTMLLGEEASGGGGGHGGGYVGVQGGFDGGAGGNNYLNTGGGSGGVTGNGQPGTNGGGGGGSDPSYSGGAGGAGNEWSTGYGSGGGGGGGDNIVGNTGGSGGTYGGGGGGGYAGGTGAQGIIVIKYVPVFVPEINITSLFNQTFQIQQAATAISSIRITDLIGGKITATNDIYIKIATSTFGYRFNTSDVSASVSGTAAAKVGATASFVSDSIMRIDVTSNFLAGEYVDISGLSYMNFISVNEARSGALIAYNNNSYGGDEIYVDDKTVAIFGILTVADYFAGQVANQWSSGVNATTSVHYRYALTSAGENNVIGTTSFALSGLSGISATDVSNIRIYGDTNRNGTVDAVPVFNLALRMGGDKSDVIRATAVDSSGNVFIVGEANVSADLNSDGDMSDTYEVASSVSSSTDIILSKWTADGGFLWTRRIGGRNFDYGYGVTLDSNGNAYITGSVYSNSDLNSDGDIADSRETINAARDAYVIKWSPDGVFGWFKRLTGEGVYENEARSIIVDSEDNVYITGKAQSSIDLNGDGDLLDTGEVGSNTGFDMFLSKWDSSGNPLWHKRLVGPNNDLGKALAVDKYNNVYLAGTTISCDLNGDGDTLDANETGGTSTDAVISKYDSSGIFQWARRIGGVENDLASSLSIDNQGNVYFSGNISLDADLNNDGDLSDADELSSNTDDIFLAKLDASGAFQWAKRIGSSSYEESFAMANDTGGDLFMSGVLSGGIDLNRDGDTGDAQETASWGGSSYDAFLGIWDDSGQFIRAKRFGYTSADYAYGLSVTKGKIYISGSVTGAADLNGDGDIADPEESSGGVYALDDMFITRMDYENALAYNANTVISGTSGTITFASSTYTAYNATTTDYLLEMSLSNLDACERMTIDFLSASALGSISKVYYASAGDSSAANHQVGTEVTFDNHFLGQIGNRWSNGSSASGVHFRYSISPANSETIDISTTTISLSSITGVLASDISGAKLYFDANHDGIADALPFAYDGQIAINGSSGSIIFSTTTPYSISTTTDFLIAFNVVNLEVARGTIGIEGAVTLEGATDFTVNGGDGAITDTLKMDFGGLAGDFCGSAGSPDIVIHSR